MTSKSSNLSEDASPFEATDLAGLSRGPKRSVNLSVNQALLDEAKALGLNLSETLRDALIEQLRTERVRQWRADNESALKSYGEYLETNRLFGTRYRSW